MAARVPSRCHFNYELTCAKWNGRLFHCVVLPDAWASKLDAWNVRLVAWNDKKTHDSPTNAARFLPFEVGMLKFCAADVCAKCREKTSELAVFAVF